MTNTVKVFDFIDAHIEVHKNKSFIVYSHHAPLGAWHNYAPHLVPDYRGETNGVRYTFACDVGVFHHRLIFTTNCAYDAVLDKVISVAYSCRERFIVPKEYRPINSNYSFSEQLWFAYTDEMMQDFLDYLSK